MVRMSFAGTRVELYERRQGWGNVMREAAMSSEQRTQLRIALRVIGEGKEQETNPRLVGSV